MITRRALVTGLSAALASWLLPGARSAHAAPQPADPQPAEALARAFAEIEGHVGGRLGVAVLDTGSGLSADLRGDERFPLCSTFKWLAAAALLSRVDAGTESLGRPIGIRAQDIITYSPATEKHVGGTMTLGEICAAAITLSDNTAGNLMLGALGAPEAVTEYARSLGDPMTRLDRTEPTLNDVPPGDPRDTTTPLSMLGDLQAVLVGEALSEASRAQLIAWLLANTTGETRLRAGLPSTWRVGDKTGTCNANTANDVGIVWPPDRAPILIAAYLAETTASREAQNAALADVGRAVAAAIG
jgi:beta-lactamase class A